MARHILQTIGTAKQLCRGSSAYMNNYLSEISDRTAVQISLLQEVFHRSSEFPQSNNSTNPPEESA